MLLNGIWNRRSHWTTGLMGLALAACSSDRIDSLERSMNDLRATQASQVEEIRSLREEFDQVRGRIDEIQHDSAGKAEEIKRSLEKFEDRMPPPPGVDVALLAEDERKIAPISGPAAERFKQGLKELRQGEFSAAAITFQQFADENPNTGFTDNAYYWQGIALREQSKFEEAIVAFNHAASKFPLEDRVPLALLELGECFLRVGSKNEAALTFEKLSEEHKGSQPAAIARQRLRELRPATSGRRM